MDYLHSALCGAAFIGGATATVLLVAAGVSMRDKQSREEIKSFWQQSIKQQINSGFQFERIADALETLAKKEAK